MANKSDNCTDWQVKVRCYDPTQAEGWSLTSKTIPETNDCVQMPGYEGETLGRPIDANLAVNFIKDFYTAVASAHGTGDIEDMTIEELKDGYTAARTFLNMLAGISYGMTIDKDFALKILSQPGCEGIRSYLCYKDDITAPISLITLGVNAAGYDLNYDQVETVKYSKGGDKPGVLPAMPGAPAVADVVMRSMGGEYSTPPYTVEVTDFFEGKYINDQNKDFYSRFVLLNVATGQQELVQMAQHPKQ